MNSRVLAPWWEIGTLLIGYFVRNTRQFYHVGFNVW